MIGTIYRAPNISLPGFIDEMDAVLSKLPDDAELVLLEDFNVDFACKQNITTTLKRKLQSFTNLHNLEQLIQHPTRLTANNESLTDVIFVNNNYRVVGQGVIHLSLSDHSLVYCIIKAGVPKASPRVIEYRSYLTTLKPQIGPLFIMLKISTMP